MKKFNMTTQQQNSVNIKMIMANMMKTKNTELEEI